MANSRYQSQIILPEIGEIGQSKLANARVLCVGCGGLAASVLPYLAAAGVGQITLLDDDKVALTNLNRQVLFTEKDVGQAKAQIVAAKLIQQNPQIEINFLIERFSLTNGMNLVGQHDLVLDCSDDYATKLAINYCCGQLHTPWVYASVLGWDGQVALFSLRDKSEPCYKCWQVRAPNNNQSCSLSGVVGAAVNQVGSVQANLTIQALLGNFHNANQLMVFDLWDLEQHKFKLNLRHGCQFHGENELELDNLLIIPTEVERLNNYTLIDIRSLDEWELGHAKHATHIEIGNLISHPENYSAKSDNLVIYCQHQSLSLMAVTNLREIGRAHV